MRLHNIKEVKIFNLLLIYFNLLDNINPVAYLMRMNKKPLGLSHIVLDCY